MNKPTRCITALAAAALLAACSDGSDYDASGTFEATEVMVPAEASGKLLYFDAAEGATVVAGQQIGAVDSMQTYLKGLQLVHQREAVLSGRPDVARQAAALREQIAQQTTERQRTANLLRDGAATTKQLDDIEANIRILQGQLDALLSTLSTSNATIDENSSALEVQIAQQADLLRKCRISSPVGGTVLAKYVEAGEWVNAGTPLMKVADVSQVFLRAYFTSDQLSRVSLGGKATVTADFGGGQRYDYPGTIVWIASESEFTPKTIQTKSSRASLSYAVKIAVANTDGRIKLGLYGEVRLDDPD